MSEEKIVDSAKSKKLTTKVKAGQQVS